MINWLKQTFNWDDPTLWALILFTISDLTALITNLFGMWPIWLAFTVFVLGLDYSYYKNFRRLPYD